MQPTGRYVQLPINTGMLEAVEKPWQPIGSARMVTLLQAAAELGVGVFASGPLAEGTILSDGKLRVRNRFASTPSYILCVEGFLGCWFVNAEHLGFHRYWLHLRPL